MFSFSFSFHLIAFIHFFCSLSSFPFPYLCQDNFDEEVEEYERKLEAEFQLCSKCTQRVGTVLNTKKNIITDLWVAFQMDRVRKSLYLVRVVFCEGRNKERKN